MKKPIQVKKIKKRTIAGPKSMPTSADVKASAEKLEKALEQKNNQTSTLFIEVE